MRVFFAFAFTVFCTLSVSSHAETTNEELAEMLELVLEKLDNQTTILSILQDKVHDIFARTEAPTMSPTMSPTSAPTNATEMWLEEQEFCSEITRPRDCNRERTESNAKRCQWKGRLGCEPKMKKPLTYEEWVQVDALCQTKNGAGICKRSSNICEWTGDGGCHAKEDNPLED